MFFGLISRFLGTILFRPYLDEGEKVLHVAHKHIWTHYRPLIKRFFFGLTIPFVIWLFFPLSKLFMIAWAVIGFMFFMYEVLNWYYDTLVVTDVSLVVIVWNGFFETSTTRIEYTYIDGVSWSKKGLAQTLFNFGDVTVERIGGGDSFVLANAVRPKDLERQIMKQQSLVVQENSLKTHENFKTLLSEMISQYAARK